MSENKIKILVVDDERNIRLTLRMILEYEKYKVLEASSGKEALSIIEADEPELVILDIKMPGMDGIEVLNRIKRSWPYIQVIMLSGHGTIETAVQATKMGAYDFLEKPIQKDRLLLAVRNAIELATLQIELNRMRSKLRDKYLIVGKSKAIEVIKETIEKIAPLDVSVLITGESGTGKELVAHNIHLLSKRASRPFIQVNCAAIPENLIENELFGHERGAYTGADTKYIGKFELANKGTIFLDEIGDMSLNTQAKILRVLQDGEFQRVGGSEILHADVRVIAATNQDLKQKISEGKFREDLYFRLNVVPIHVPPLRERVEDIELLTDFFVKKYIDEMGLKPKVFTKSAIEKMKRYNWPGNIRELKNFVLRTLILVDKDRIEAEDLKFDHIILKRSEEVPEFIRNLPKTLKEYQDLSEKYFIIKKLEEYNWNIKAVAQAINTPRSNLYKKLKYYGIKPEEHR